jgi:prepilin-type N-terminal cleavage/methylation domain-containing protein
MKNKKKGFTLVELIISITLLALIGLSIGISLTKVSKSREKDSEDVVINKVKSAADVYLSTNTEEMNKLYTSNSYLIIKVSELKSAGLLDENLTDPTTGDTLSDDAEVLASLDETGAIVYTYPADADDKDHLQVQNVYLEKNEKVNCEVGMNTISLVYVKGNGSYDKNYLNSSNISCDLSPLDNTKTGTYKITYSYKLVNGVTKNATRNFIVQDPVEVSLDAKTAISKKTVLSGQWSTEEIKISPKINRKANIVYSWIPNTNVDSSNTITAKTSGIYTLNYIVKYINSDIQAYEGKITYDAKIELFNEVNAIIPTVSGDQEWHNKEINITTGTASTPVSGIKEYRYCLTTSDNCTPNTIIDNGSFSVSTLGKNKVFVNFLTNAGNISGTGSNSAYFDNVAPVFNDSSKTYTDNLSGVKSTKYFSSSINNTPSIESNTWNDSILSPGIGVTYYNYSYAEDIAGNKSIVNYEGSKYGGDVTYYYDPPVNSTPQVETCDYACSIIKSGEAWSEICSGCSVDSLNEKLKETGPIDVGGGRVLTSYDDIKNFRTEGGYESANNGSCTIGVTCEMYNAADPSYTIVPDTTTTTDPIVIPDIHIDPIVIPDIHIDPIVIEPIVIDPITCLKKGTRILLANGEYKNIEDIDYTDLITTYSYDTGKTTKVYGGWIEKGHHAESYQKNTFEDGSELDTIGYHGMFDCDRNEFISVDDTSKFQVGTRVLKIKDNNKYCVKVTNIETINEPVTYYHIESVRYLNVIANDFLTTDGNVMLSNVYGFTKDIRWKTDKTILENNKRNLFSLEEINTYSYYPKYLYLAMGSANTKYLTAFANISNDRNVLFTLLELQHALTDMKFSLNPEKNNLGVNMWKVSTSDNYDNDNLFEEGSYYTLPEPKNKNNFVGWYQTGENKIYQPGEKAQINYATHFEGIYR